MRPQLGQRTHGKKRKAAIITGSSREKTSWAVYRGTSLLCATDNCRRLRLFSAQSSHIHIIIVWTMHSRKNTQLTDHFLSMVRNTPFCPARLKGNHWRIQIFSLHSVGGRLSKTKSWEEQIQYQTFALIKWRYPLLVLHIHEPLMRRYADHLNGICM